MSNVESFDINHIPEFKSADKKNWEGDLKLMKDAYNYSLVTIWHKGKILAIAGVQIIRRKVAEVFSLPSIYAKKFPKEYLNVMRQIVDSSYRIFDLHRLQLTIVDSDIMGLKWAKSLGFTYEGLLVKYGENGENHFLFAKVI